MTGYFSVADRGTFGHWDISDGKKRVFCIRGEPGQFCIRDERLVRNGALEHMRFRTPSAALLWIAEELMPGFPTPLDRLARLANAEHALMKGATE